VAKILKVVAEHGVGAGGATHRWQWVKLGFRVIRFVGEVVADRHGREVGKRGW
jgi:hypothetical protein